MELMASGVGCYAPETVRQIVVRAILGPIRPPQRGCRLDRKMRRTAWCVHRQERPRMKLIGRYGATDDRRWVPWVEPLQETDGIN
jgi:hypothetical protein